MKFVLCLMMSLLGFASTAQADNSTTTTLSDPDGDYVQIFHKKTDLVEAFKKSGYLYQDPMVVPNAIHKKTWCIIRLEEKVHVVEIECGGKNPNVKTIAIVNNDYSIVPVEVAKLRKKHSGDGINLFTHQKKDNSKS